ncbi:MAG: copper-binding transcription factor [Bathelium mastoideum]|nr:MAG: copper-binding transcription factor [Bathelium mastoideum]
MSAPSTKPRRRANKPAAPLVTPAVDASATMSLKKGNTFHSPTRLSSDLGNLSITNSPKRSYTSSQSLEELVAGEQRVAEVIDRVNKTLSGFHSSATGASLLKDPEVLPLPSFMLDSTSLPPPNHNDAKCCQRRTRQADHTHGSDSGIGSSIGGSTNYSASAASTVSSSAITKSHAAISSGSATGHVLSQHAVKQIQIQIVKPILAEETLKEFHPLVEEVPVRIGSKDITNLRDLEKTLIFLAPVSRSILGTEFGAIAHEISLDIKGSSVSPDSYVRFCEFAVRCIHATVPALGVADQRLPADRPYTDGYFLDLVEQIRKYAAIMAATREKEAKGEALDEMDFSPTEKLTLKGGMSQDGSPLELVREKDGKTIPIASDEDRAAASSKRSVGEDSDDDELAIRSMARRRKSEKPGDVVRTCRDCGKDFKRPCDLTKHEKTHSRPWKCPHAGCKYHDYGWPTEKEMDRHINDKHSAAPSLFKCRFHPCSYSSKRESNCKQHMEKAHGWTYVRSKSNGKKKGGVQQLNTDVSPAAQVLSTPMTPYAPSPVFSSWNASSAASNESLPPSNSNLFPVPDFAGVFPEHNTVFGSEQGPFSFNDLDMNIPGATNGPFGHTPAMSSDGRRGSHTTSSNPALSSNPSPAEPTAFVDAFTPDQQPELNLATEFDSAGFMFTTGGMQQPTPATSVGPADMHLNMNADVYNPNNMTEQVNPQHISPLSGQDVPLYSPANQMNLDEGFVDDMSFQPPQNGYQPRGVDFELFPSNAGIAEPLFSDLPQQNATSMAYQTWNVYQTSNNTYNDTFGFNGQQ